LGHGSGSGLGKGGGTGTGEGGRSSSCVWSLRSAPAIFTDILPYSSWNNWAAASWEESFAFMPDSWISLLTLWFPATCPAYQHGSKTILMICIQTQSMTAKVRTLGAKNLRKPARSRPTLQMFKRQNHICCSAAKRLQLKSLKNTCAVFCLLI